MSTINSPMTLAKSDVRIPRSVFHLSPKKTFSMSAGFLYPFYCAEVLPGDSCRQTLSFVSRMQTPIHPTMGDAYQDIAFFFVPNRIIFDDWKQFYGESPKDPYINPVQHVIPHIRMRTETEGAGPINLNIPFNSVLDYLGLPAGNNFATFNALPVRAFCEIWNEFYRDQNLQYAIDFSRGSEDVDFGSGDPGYGSNPDVSDFGWTKEAEDYYSGNNNDYYIRSTAVGGVLPPVNKFHDLFTSATLEPQKGDAVPIPLSSFDSNALPVITGDQHGILQNAPTYFYGGPSVSLANGNVIGLTRGEAVSSSISGIALSNEGLRPANLWASAGDMYSTINDLRYAFSLQKYLELDNFGTRYRELLFNHYKVLSPDASMQIPEFLGGKTFRIGMQQTVQTSATGEGTPQGNIAAYSLTADRGSFFEKSFTEHGFIIGVTCIRTEPTYEQAVSKFWNYREKIDIYTPEFGAIGDEPIRVNEIWNDRSSEDLTPAYFNEYFGFTEAWYQYRTSIDTIAGQLRTNHPNSLAYWTYSEYFEDQPYLNDEFIRQKRDPIGKTLAVDRDWHYDQFICDFKCEGIWTRPVSLYSMPWFGGRF